MYEIACYHQCNPDKYTALISSINHDNCQQTKYVVLQHFKGKKAEGFTDLFSPFRSKKSSQF